MVSVGEQAVAIVDDRHSRKQVARKGVLGIVVEDRRSTADRLRPEARARPVGNRRVEGNAPDHRVHAPERLGIFPTHEEQGPGMGRIGGGRGRIADGKGMINRLRGHGQVPALAWFLP